jgi:hypothetical protein
MVIAVIGPDTPVWTTNRDGLFLFSNTSSPALRSSSQDPEHSVIFHKTGRSKRESSFFPPYYDREFKLLSSYTLSLHHFIFILGSQITLFRRKVRVCFGAIRKRIVFYGYRASPFLLLLTYPNNIPVHTAKKTLSVSVIKATPSHPHILFI